MMKKKKIKSVIELAKYQAGEKVYFLDLVNNVYKNLLPSDLSWMTKCHPKVYYTEGVYKFNTQSKHVFPRLPSSRFGLLSAILSSHFITQSFNTTLIDRCKNTGEFYYFDGINEWHPETILFTSLPKTKAEKRRILNLIMDWVITNDSL